MALSNKIVCALRAKFKDIPQILFDVSLLYAETDGHLFDILCAFPQNYPIVWDKENKLWVTSSIEKITQVS